MPSSILLRPLPAPRVAPAQPRRALGSTLALSLLLAAGCDDPLAPARAITTSLARASGLPAEVADTPAGQQLAWVLHRLHAGCGAVDAGEIAARFHPRYLDKKTVHGVTDAFASIAETSRR